MTTCDGGHETAPSPGALGARGRTSTDADESGKRSVAAECERGDDRRAGRAGRDRATAANVLARLEILSPLGAVLRFVLRSAPFLRFVPMNDPARRRLTRLAIAAIATMTWAHPGDGH